MDLGLVGCPLVDMEFFTVFLSVHSTNMGNSKPTVFIFHIVIPFHIIIIPIHKHHWGLEEESAVGNGYEMEKEDGKID